MNHPRITIILLFASLLALAATTVKAQNAEEHAARLIDSFGRVPDGDIRGRTDAFLAELSNNAGAKGIVWVHGTPAEIVGRIWFFQNLIKFRSFDASRVSFLKGRNIGDVRTDFWLVPEGAHEPDVKPEAWIGVEFGSVTAAVGKRKIAAFFADKDRTCSNQIQIINYGTPKQIAQRETWLQTFVYRAGMTRRASRSLTAVLVRFEP